MSADIIVPICAEKSIWVPVAILAILKGRAIFVLLDHFSLPKERLENFIESLNSKLLIRSRETPDFSLRSMNLITIDEGILDLETEYIPRVQRLESSRACIVFSPPGVHGPEGIELSHSFILSLISQDSEHYFEFRRHDRILQFASYAFVEILV